MPAGEHCISVVRPDVEIVQDVSAVVTRPVQSSFSIRRERIRRGSQAVGLVGRQRVGVLERKTGCKTASHLNLERVVVGDRTIVARQHFSKVREAQVLLAKLRSGHKGGITNSVGLYLIEVGA